VDTRVRFFEYLPYPQVCTHEKVRALSAALEALVALVLLIRVERAVVRPTGERLGSVSKLPLAVHAVRGDLAACSAQRDPTALYKLLFELVVAFLASIAAAVIARTVVVILAAAIRLMIAITHGAADSLRAGLYFARDLHEFIFIYYCHDGGRTACQ
jgi:hypothetical protein